MLGLVRYWRPKAMVQQEINAQIILDNAIALAMDSSWESFSLLALATAVGCDLSLVRKFYRSKDDMAEAIFDRADQAMLQLTANEDFKSQSVDDKTILCIMCWFDSLASYKPIIREILMYKLEPGHIHLQAHGITRISRTVQWFREAADRRHLGLSRIADEIGLTSAYLTSFSFFLMDQSKQHIKTKNLLKKLISQLNRPHVFFSGCNGSSNDRDDSNRTKID